jgi:hypothetical protein
MRSSTLVDSDPSASSSSSSSSPHGSYGTFVAYCFTVNYVLGVGILGIPWGFVRAGVALSPLVLLVVSLLRCGVKNHEPVDVIRFVHNTDRIRVQY